MPAELPKVEYVEMSKAEFQTLAGPLLRGQVGYAGGMPPPPIPEVQLRRGRDRSGVKRVPCGGGFRVLRKKIGSN